MKQDLCKCGSVKREGYEQCRKCYLEYYKNRTTKFCSKCNTDLPLDKFRKKSDGRPRSACRECEARMAREARQKMSPEEKRIKKKEYYHSHLDIVRKASLRKAWKKMGLDPLQVESYKNSHPNVCEICGKEDEYQDISVDHCHNKKIFRGLLCSKCNMGIGLFQDNPQLLLKAVEYLTSRAFPDKLDQFQGQ